MKTFAFALIFLTACGGTDDPQERIQKLRAIGASALPLISQPSKDGEEAKKVELTLYAALPEGHLADIQPYRDDDSYSAVMLEENQIEIQYDSITYQSYPGFQVMSFKAHLAVPNQSAFIRFGGAGQVRYGFNLTDGTETEKIIGNFMVYPEGSPEFAWEHPEVSITEPLAGATLSAENDNRISALPVNTNNEELTIGWFASSGEISNRRAKATTWTTPASGAQTLIVTVRGKKSRGFAWQVVTINAE